MLLRRSIPPPVPPWGSLASLAPAAGRLDFSRISGDEGNPLARNSLTPQDERRVAIDELDERDERGDSGHREKQGPGHRAPERDDVDA